MKPITVLLLFLCVAFCIHGLRVSRTDMEARCTRLEAQVDCQAVCLEGLWQKEFDRQWAWEDSERTGLPPLREGRM